MTLETVLRGSGVAALLAACGGAAEEPAPAATTRDSAGVLIVENMAPARAGSPLFEVDSVPVLDLGGAGGDPHQEFGGVAGAFRLSDGAVAVIDGQNNVVRLFDSTGAWRRDLGRKGGGPGEFVDILGAFLLPGDTVAIWDFTHRRLTRFAPGGALAGTIGFVGGDGEPSAPSLAGILSDGRLVVMASRLTLPRPGSVVQRDLIPVRIYSAAAEPLDSILSLPETEALVRGTRTTVFQSDRPFGKRLQLRVDGERIVVGTGDSYEIREYDAAGRLLRIVRRPHEAAPVTAADIETVLAARRERLRSEPARFRRQIQAADDPAEFPEHKPHFADLLVAADGALWIREYDQPATDQPSRWEIFGADGRWLGHAVLPPRLRPTQIGSGFVLGVRPDDDDVPHVHLYRLKAVP